VNGLRLSVVRGGGAITAIAVHRRGKHVVTHAADGIGLLPGFAAGTDLSPEEACWVMVEASRLVLGVRPRPWPFWKYLAVTAAVLVLLVPVAFLFGFAIKTIFLQALDTQHEVRP
jgi:hypothetical protein